MQNNLLTSVFIRLRSGLQAKARYLLGSDAEAEDALQDAFCRLWSSPVEITDQRQAEAMSYATVRNVSIDRLRRQQAHPETHADTLPDSSDDADTDQADLVDEVKSLIESQLPERDREMLYKRDMHGYEYDELALEYGISEANARVIVSRARKTIRQIYLNRNQYGH